MNYQMETRVLTGQQVSSTEPKKIAGYAARFLARTVIGTGDSMFTEQIMPGAFSNCLDMDVRLCRDHNPSLLLARTRSGTCELSQDSAGLFFRASLPDTALGQETCELIRRQDLSQCSFSFSLADGDDVWTQETDSATGRKFALRSIRNVSQLYDVSVCSFGQYTQTSVDIARGFVPESVLQEARAFNAKHTSVGHKSEDAQQLLDKALRLKADWQKRQFAL